MSKFLKARHTFRFRVGEGADAKIISVRVRVRRSTAPVSLTLTAADVRQSMKLHGVGNTQTCSMAVCAKRQAHAFPHEVEGYIDWQYRTAYVVTKVSKATGLPSECVGYEHQDNIAKINDTAGGQKKILSDLEKNGDRVIRLYPMRRQKWYRPNSTGKKDGSRATKPVPRGAALRFAVAQLGGVAA